MGKTAKEAKKKDKKTAVPDPVPPVRDRAAAKGLHVGTDCNYAKELRRLQVELVKFQEWVRHEKLQVVVLFEGRDGAGKGGTIKRITDSLNPRMCRVVALPAPTEREKMQWYFQRYIAHLPAAGEIVFFDRSWYNRVGSRAGDGFLHRDGVCRVLAQSCPQFERMVVRAGTILVKYWFSVADDEQERRFQGRLRDRTKRWKLSPMDLESRSRWVEYSRAKDEMFAHTDIKQAPWYVVNADDKKCARLNVIRHLSGRDSVQRLDAALHQAAAARPQEVRPSSHHRPEFHSRILQMSENVSSLGPAAARTPAGRSSSSRSPRRGRKIRLAAM